MHKINLAVNLRDFGAKNFSGIFCDRRGAGENSWDGIGRECGLGAQEKDRFCRENFPEKIRTGLAGAAPQKSHKSCHLAGGPRGYLGPI